MTTARRPLKSNPKVKAQQSQPKAIAHRPAQQPQQLARQPENKAYVVEVDDLAFEVSDVNPFKTAFFHSIANVKALTAHGQVKVVDGKKKTLAQARGYSRDDLFAIAEIGYHYLFSGGVNLALTLFEGLTAVAPQEAYFALALGLTHDHLQNPNEANRWYSLASELDPSDGRADVNRAELYLERGDKRSARKLLERGAQKARSKGDLSLSRKAMALINHLDRSARS
jgi:Flp pilus assembly protein TadD